MSFRKSSISSGEYYDGQHRFEHWYRDNSIYFITARCRDRFPRTHRYIWLQPVRHGIVKDPREYPHTREIVKVDAAVRRALELHAYLEDVPYKRYER
jgi:hypothetical protein